MLAHIQQSHYLLCWSTQEWVKQTLSPARADVPKVKIISADVPKRYISRVEEIEKALWSASPWREQVELDCNFLAVQNSSIGDLVTD